VRSTTPHRVRDARAWPPLLLAWSWRALQTVLLLLLCIDAGCHPTCSSGGSCCRGCSGDTWCSADSSSEEPEEQFLLQCLQC
jgi:hypothetical protein